MNPPTLPPRLPRALRALAEFFRLEAAGGITLIVAAGLAMIAANSPWAALYNGLGEVGAARIGQGLGLSPVLTGLLPVAIGTALPEIAAAVVAAKRGHGDMVMGHVIGASVFNMLVILGGMAAFGPLDLPMTQMSLKPLVGSFMLPLGYEMLAALAFALMLYPVLRGDLRVSRGEGVALVLAYCLFVVVELLASR